MYIDHNPSVGEARYKTLLVMSLCNSFVVYISGVHVLL